MQINIGVALARSAVIGCAAITLVYGQSPMSPERITALRALSTDLHQRHLAERRQVVRLAAAAGIPVRRVLPDGRIAELQRFINGRPQCYITTNLDAARTVSTDSVWLDGGMGLDLTGSGITAGIWDDGGVLTTHQEFGGRVTSADGSAIGSNHPTHVAGTMIASGIDPEAKGMAGEASLESYDWFNDSGEMAVAAAAGLALSNHSYSYIVGWQQDSPKTGWNWWGDAAINDTVDYFFGFYDTTAHDWDSIAVNAPYYLIVAAAGNDRWDDGPPPGESHWVWDGGNWVLSTALRSPDGDFDCLPGGPQVAKNVLVVGAVDDIPDGYAYTTDVAMTPFSSWGPTDDGRIKPDLVANGMDLYSTLASSDTDYGPLSGTSMAAPNVTGSVALLQQHYRQTHNGDLPLAATLRALLIHTADEAGNSPGPDYIHGWGLLNTAAAVELISRDAGGQWIIKELTLNEGESYSTTVTSDGPDPLKVTIAWTDPPATPLSPALNDITARLINDLDLQITRESDSQTYYPWCLDVEHPDWAATQDDNNVDNVEQVLIPTTGPGEYIVTVSHKSALLAGTQDFSMVITGASMPQVLVWEGIQSGTDYSGVFIRDTLPVVGDVDVTYTTTFPESLSVFDAAFLSFGPSSGLWANRTSFDDGMAAVVQAYLEGGGSLYLEGGDALGEGQAGNAALLSLLGIESVTGGYDNPIDSLVGQTSTITDGMLFTASTQEYSQYIDRYTPGTGAAAFVESNYDTVAVQHTGPYGQRTFVFSYALAGLVDGDSPSTRSDLLAAILDFFLEEPPPPPNNAPLAWNDTVTTWEDSAVTIPVLANDIDPNGDSLVLTDLTPAIHGEAVIDPGDTTVTYTPNSNFNGSDTFTYVVSDDNGGLDTGTVEITVSPLNDKPIAGADLAATLEDNAVTVLVLLNDTDIDGDALHVAAITSGYRGSTSIGNDNTTVTYMPNLNFNGSDTFTYIVSDGNGGLDTGTVEITVSPVNDKPMAGTDQATTTEDVAVTISVLRNDTDIDGDTLIIAAVTSGNNGSAAKNNGDTTVTYTPNPNFIGSDTFTYVVSDGHGGLDTGIVEIIVTQVNDPPVFISTLADTSFKEDSTLSLPLSLWFHAVEDEETPDSQLIWSITGNDSVSTTFSADADSVLFAAPLNWHGEDTLSVIASDGAQADTTALIITVFPVNDAPGNFAILTPAGDSTLVITSGNLGDTLTFSWESADDVDGDAVRYGALVTGDLSIVLTIDDTTANEVRLANADIAALLEAADRSSGVSGTWIIFASDGEGTTRADNGPFTLTVSVVLAIDLLSGLPEEFALRQNYPNPFNPSTTLRFALPRAVEVRLVVVDLLGREIARLVDGHLAAGYHQVTWDGKTHWGKEAPSGVYIVRMFVPDALGRGMAPGFVRQVKMVLLK